MNNGFNEDFKNDGLISQFVRRISLLERFEREFRLKKFGSTGHIFLPFAAYSSINPVVASGANPYSVSVDRDMTGVRWSQAAYVVAPNDAVNYWRLQILRVSDGSVDIEINTSAIPPNAFSLLTETIFTISAITAADIGLNLSCLKVNAPGNLYLLSPLLEVTIP